MKHPGKQRQNTAGRITGLLAVSIVLLWLAACARQSSASTLVPTVLLPTLLPSWTPRPSPSPSPPAVTARPQRVVPYTIDSSTGEMMAVGAQGGAFVRVQPATDRLWVINENIMVEYRSTALYTSSTTADVQLTPFKVITYTYDAVGRRLGWTMTWPEGPTITQELCYLHEGLLVVGEQLRVGEVVTTTYYPWATRDRRAGLDASAVFSTNLPITDATRYDPVCQAVREMDCLSLLAAIIVSEASVGVEEERQAVAWTVRNRLDRGLSLRSYAMSTLPGPDYYEMAYEMLTAPLETDPTNGATHFFSPRSMPLQGEESLCKQGGGIYDCQGGLIYVEGLDRPAYTPFWHLIYQWAPVPGVRKTHFLFYRIPPIQPRVGGGADS